MYIFAFLGTGQCDPNKGIKQLGAVVAITAIIASTLYASALLGRSKLKPLLRFISIFLLTSIGSLGALGLGLAAWVGLACSG